MNAGTSKHINIAGAVSFGLPLFLYMLTSGIHSYWLDSPEFTAAAFEIGLPHPPGHPIYVLLAKAFTLVPLGTIAWRVSLFSAVCGAVASWLLFRTSLIVTRYTVEPVRPMHVWISLGCALWASLSYAWWFQSVRSEVYALQIMLTMGAVYTFILWFSGEDEKDDRLLLMSCFIFGLALSNHHFCALAALPAAVPALTSEVRRRGLKKLGPLGSRAVALSAWGLVPYAFLPLRTMALPRINLGACNDFSSCFWVISAKAFQRSMAHHHAENLAQRSMNVLFTLMDQLHPVLVIISLGGLYILWRRPASRPMALFMTLVIAVVIGMRAVMGFDPFNPDYYGYMLLAVAVLSAVAGAAVLTAVEETKTRLQRPGAVAGFIFTAAFLTGAVHDGKRVYEKSDLSGFDATEKFTVWSLERVPPGAVVITHFYKTAFAYWSSTVTEGYRRDISWVHPPFMGFPGYSQRMLKSDPDLRDLLRGILATGSVTTRTLSDLVQKRPVKIEMDLTVPSEIHSMVLPDGVLYDVAAEPLSKGDLRLRAPLHNSLWSDLYGMLGNEVTEPETWRMLVWFHYMDGLFFARQGLLAEAKKSLMRAHRLGSESTEINALLQAVEKASGPVDILPFLPQTDHPVPLGLVREALERDINKGRPE